MSSMPLFEHEISTAFESTTRNDCILCNLPFFNCWLQKNWKRQNQTLFSLPVKGDSLFFHFIVWCINNHWPRYPVGLEIIKMLPTGLQWVILTSPHHCTYSSSQSTIYTNVHVLLEQNVLPRSDRSTVLCVRPEMLFGILSGIHFSSSWAVVGWCQNPHPFIIVFLTEASWSWLKPAHPRMMNSCWDLWIREAFWHSTRSVGKFSVVMIQFVCMWIVRLERSLCTLLHDLGCMSRLMGGNTVPLEESRDWLGHDV